MKKDWHFQNELPLFEIEHRYLIEIKGE